MSTPEHSDRAKYVTEQVALWIVNDGDYRRLAYARLGKQNGLNRMAGYLEEIIRDATPYRRAPWQVAQELAPNDYARIDWEYVADQLGGD